MESEAKKRDDIKDLINADPIIVAKRHNDEYIALISALFAYGNAKMILKFLNSLDFSYLDKNEDEIDMNRYYRFQNERDVDEFFITIKRARERELLDVFLDGYKSSDVISGINSIIEYLYSLNDYRSQGYEFLLGKPSKKEKGSSALKRYNMFLRWMVRKDSIDLGLWSDKVDKKDLILPLDTHTFNISKKLGLCERKTYDLCSAKLITEKLKEFDKNDPIKYDFAIYRIGQEKLI